MKALILIGGLGTRLRPLTCYRPKPLLPILNKPFLEYQFQLLRKHGIREVILCVAYLSHEFENYCGNGDKWGLKIHYVHEKEPLGTGGAIRNAIDYIDQPTVIFNGDILTDIDLTAMCRYHKSNKAFITIGLTRVNDPTNFGLVETNRNGRIERFLEKPSWDEITCNTINAGIYVFQPEVLQYIPEGINFSVERGLFPNLLSQNYPLFGYTSNRYWMDIGTIEKYLQAHFDLMQRDLSFDLPGRKTRNNVWSGKKLKIGKNVVINGQLVCGDNVVIEDYVQLHGSVCLGNGVKIGKGSMITDSVLHNSVRIDDGVRLEKVLLGENCLVEANATLGALTTLGNGSKIGKYSRL